MITEKVWELLEKVYESLHEFVELVGLEYDYDDEEYVCKNLDEVDEEWCDDEMLEALENSHMNLRYFFGK